MVNPKVDINIWSVTGHKVPYPAFKSDILLVHLSPSFLHIRHNVPYIGGELWL